MDREEIAKIKKRRDSLKIKIREKMNRKKPAYDLVKEFTDLTNILISQGHKLSINAECLKLENWTESGYKDWSEKDMIPVAVDKAYPNKLPIKIKQKTKPVEDYSICLAWTEKSGSDKPVQVKKVEEFFEELCLKKLDYQVNKIDTTRSEYILKYEYPGTEDAFRLLKMCTQFVLDSFAVSDYDRFNIAIYGKKKMQ